MMLLLWLLLQVLSSSELIDSPVPSSTAPRTRKTGIVDVNQDEDYHQGNIKVARTEHNNKKDCEKGFEYCAASEACLRPARETCPDDAIDDNNDTTNKKDTKKENNKNKKKQNNKQQKEEKERDDKEEKSIVHGHNHQQEQHHYYHHYHQKQQQQQQERKRVRTNNKEGIAILPMPILPHKILVRIAIGMSFYMLYSGIQNDE